MHKTAVILINLGTPAAPTKPAIRAFLRQFLFDKRVVPLPRLVWWLLLNIVVLPLRLKKLVPQYRSIWLKKGSPLDVYMQELTTKLQSARSSLTWHYAMSYSAPFLTDVIHECLQQTIENIIVLPLYPQYASSTTGAVFDQIFKSLQGKCSIPKLTLMNRYYDHPAYIDALAQSVKTYWLSHPKPQKLLMSFHGIPQNSVTQGDPYATQCDVTAQALAKALQLAPAEWQLVYQSRFGKTRWLQPYCDKTLQALPSQGITNVQVICPGFAIDCLETLEEIAKTNKQVFLDAGGKSYAYIPALNANNAQCELMQALIKENG